MWRKEQTLDNSKKWKSAIVPQKLYPDRTKLLPSVQPNFIEDDEGKGATSFHHKVHMSPSVPRIISPEVPVPSPRVQTAQPPRLDKRGPSSNLRPRGKKTPIPLYALTEQFQKNMKPMQLPIKYLEWPRNTDIWLKSQRGKFGKYPLQTNWESYFKVSEG